MAKVSNIASEFVSYGDIVNQILVNEVVRKDTGDINTLAVLGLMGQGKTSITYLLSDIFPDYKDHIIDLAIMDRSDFFYPMVDKEKRIADQALQKYFGVSTNEKGEVVSEPVILCIDELWKGDRDTINTMLPIALHRTVQGKSLHPDSIVFATGNLAEENVGDTFQDHQIERFTFVKVKPHTSLEYVNNYALKHKMCPEGIAFVLEHEKKLSETFLDLDKMMGDESGQLKTLEDRQTHNDWIHDPKVARPINDFKFFTWRSFTKACNYIPYYKKGGVLNGVPIEPLGDDGLQNMLNGTVGASMASELMTFVRMVDKYVPHREIIADPENVRLPDRGASEIMVLQRGIDNLDSDNITPWMTFLDRLSKEAQAMFALSCYKSEEKRELLMHNKEFTAWARVNAHLFHKEDDVGVKIAAWTKVNDSFPKKSK